METEEEKAKRIWGGTAARQAIVSQTYTLEQLRAMSFLEVGKIMAARKLGITQPTNPADPRWREDLIKMILDAQSLAVKLRAKSLYDLEHLCLHHDMNGDIFEGVARNYGVVADDHGFAHFERQAEKEDLIEKMVRSAHGCRLRRPPPKWYSAAADPEMTAEQYREKLEAVPTTVFASGRRDVLCSREQLEIH